MHRSSSELPQKSFRIKQDDEFFSRLLTKESAMSKESSSFRVYDGATPGAVPFIWESQPGTPKHAISSSKLPPLTPPPSYYYNHIQSPSKRTSKSGIFSTLLPRLNIKRPHVSPPSSLSSPSFTNSYPSSPSTPHRVVPLNNFHRRSRFSSPRLSFSSMGDEEYHAAESPTSPFCFPLGRGSGRERASCYSVFSMKNALMSMVCHKSSQSTIA